MLFAEDFGEGGGGGTFDVGVGALGGFLDFGFGGFGGRPDATEGFERALFGGFVAAFEGVDKGGDSSGAEGSDLADGRFFLIARLFAEQSDEFAHDTLFGVGIGDHRAGFFVHRLDGFAARLGGDNRQYGEQKQCFLHEKDSFVGGVSRVAVAKATEIVKMTRREAACSVFLAVCADRVDA